VTANTRKGSTVNKISAIYCRVSSRDRPVAWFKDTFTGKSMNRPGMDRLTEELHAGRLERIVVWRLDRLGRTTKERRGVKRTGWLIPGVVRGSFGTCDGRVLADTLCARHYCFFL
jgi:hypothetical protein